MGDQHPGHVLAQEIHDYVATTVMSIEEQGGVDVSVEAVTRMLGYVDAMAVVMDHTLYRLYRLEGHPG